MSGFMKYLTKINDSLIEDEEDEKFISEEKVEEPKKVIKHILPVKKTIPQKVDTSVSILEDRMRSKLDDIGLNSKLINEVISFVLSDVKHVPNINVGMGNNITNENKQVQPISINEFKIRNDIRGAAEYLLDGLPDMNNSNNSIENNSNFTDIHTGYKSSSIIDRASSLV